MIVDTAGDVAGLAWHGFRTERATRLELELAPRDRPTSRGRVPESCAQRAMSALYFLLALAPALLLLSAHQVPEGYVGVYWRGGALLNETASPGWNARTIS